MRELDTNFVAEKNKQENAIIYLYTIYDYDGVGTPLYFTDQDTNITFDGIEYIKSSITHEPISENSQGRVDEVNVQISNVSREIEYYLQQHSALRGKKISIKMVFADHLDDPDIKNEDILHQ